MEERSDIDIGTIARFGAWLAIAALAIHLLMWALFAYFQGRESAGDRPALPVAGELPPEPRLRVAPRDDMRALREEDERRLESYGWVDRPAGVVRIPIERAIDLTAERGLPARKDER